MAGLLRPDGTPNRDAEHLCVHADYDLSVSTETLFNLCEAVLTLLGVPFSIRKVPPVTEDPAATRRRTHATSSSSRSGFTCRNDIFEAIMVSQAIDAAMVCGMDWDEHNGFFIFSDRWHTRDNNGDTPPILGLLLRVRHARRRPHADVLHRPYRAGVQVTNLSSMDTAPCLNSLQVYFCRDLWLSAAHEGVRAIERHAGAAGSGLDSTSAGAR
ncbi:hypothetical protein DFH11DRAFT_1730383 [Phellopilus nigrolimitatus]|nr:hypothetical protein DFH11DRAFT_1730383 [Phellopilus nigrolimitatus]